MTKIGLPPRGSFSGEGPDAGLLRYLGPSRRAGRTATALNAVQFGADLGDPSLSGDYRQYVAQLRIPQFGGQKVIRNILRPFFAVGGGKPRG